MSERVTELMKSVVYLGLFSERGCINTKEFRRKVIGLFANKYTCEQKYFKEVQHKKVKGIHDSFSLITNIFTSNTGIRL
jgi:hypothetical protein